MARARSRYVCQECGGASVRWLGRCPYCGGWNTLVEEIQAAAATAVARPSISSGVGPAPISQVSTEQIARLDTGFGELNRALGGGLVPGSLVLVGGDPGIGKSTLLLQASHNLSRQGAVLYVSGEESREQVRMRADRLGCLSDTLLVAAESDLSTIESYCREASPRVLVVDSIQTVFRPELESAPGSVAQVRESTAHLLRLAKSTGTAVILVGHVTKEGSLAGPRVLEHAVDTVLYFEGDRHHAYRILRAVKNRFGSTNELGIFEMVESGLREVPNPSEVFLSGRPEGSSGSVVVASLEGTRPILAEVQALVSPSSFATPRRTTEGVELPRLLLILAVLEKRLGMPLGMQDVYVKVTGGVVLSEPAVDLALAVAVASGYREIPVNPQLAIAGEVGLAGEVRAVTRLEERLREAERLGFKRFVAPRAGVAPLDSRRFRLAVDGVATVTEALEAALPL